MKRDRMVFLRHMLICIDRIADYTRDGRTAFMAPADLHCQSSEPA